MLVHAVPDDLGGGHREVVLLLRCRCCRAAEDSCRSTSPPVMQFEFNKKTLEFFFPLGSVSVNL